MGRPHGDDERGGFKAALLRAMLGERGNRRLPLVPGRHGALLLDASHMKNSPRASPPRCSNVKPQGSAFFSSSMNSSRSLKARAGEGTRRGSRGSSPALFSRHLPCPSEIHLREHPIDGAVALV
jgi:hypothetical protein